MRMRAYVARIIQEFIIQKRKINIPEERQPPLNSLDQIKKAINFSLFDGAPHQGYK